MVAAPGLAQGTGLPGLVLPAIAAQVLEGRVQGRTMVDVNA